MKTMSLVFPERVTIASISIISIFALLLPTAVSQNLALGKPVGGSGYYGGYRLELSVDGNLGLPDCALPQAPEGSNVEWWVDLQDTYRVTSIVLYNTDGGAGGPSWLRYFILSVGASLSDLTDCGPDFRGSVSRGGYVTRECNQTGRFVHFRRTGEGNKPYFVVLCEVEVFGRNQYSCDLCPVGSPCNSDDGCSQCPLGKQTPECDRDCTVGTYGLDCVHQCGQCAQPEDCSIVDGVCSGECQTWWIDGKCDREIVIPLHTSENVASVESTNSTLQVRWQQLASIPQDLERFYGYVVFSKKEEAQTYTESTRVPHSGGGYTSAVIHILEYNTRYDIQVVPYREHAGAQTLGETYPVIAMKTLCGHPAPPAGITAEKVPAQYLIRVSWNDIRSPAILSRCESILGLRVEYRMSSTAEWRQESVAISTTTTDLAIPEGDATYQVKVVSINNENFESSSEVHIVIIGTGGGNTAVIASVVVVVLVIVAIVIVIAVIMIRKRNHAKDTERAVSAKSNPIFDNHASNEIIEETESHIIMKPKHTNIRVELTTQRVQKDTKPKVKSSKPAPKPSPMIQPSKHHNTPATYENVIMAVPGSKQDLLPDVDYETEEETDIPEVRPKSELELSELDLGAVAIPDFENFVIRKTASMSKFIEEYKSLPPNNNARCYHGQTKNNKLKNRFLNIYPYDDTRVVLDTETRYSSDYINANYITGFNNKKEYIATQGPREDTVVDLWRMIWQENANRVVMVANLTEGAKKRCARYWPETRGSMKWGDFTVTLETQISCADYTHRTLSVRHRETIRTIHHFHFTSWEDKNNPVYGAITLFAFHRMVHSVDSISRGSMVVHCSAGVGRTGTFVVFDILLDQARQAGEVDVYSWVQKVREERMTMVQTKEQYIFLHKALVEYFKGGDTCYNRSVISERYQAINQSRSKPDRSSELQRQFHVLGVLASNADMHMANGQNPENIHKNRDQQVIADDRQRPYLNTPYKAGNDYINAVFVSSYKAHREYIVTQMPLPGTVVDFWRLVHEQNCNTIVMLNNMDKNDPTCVPYWPSENQPKQTYGPIEVEILDVKTVSPAVKMRDFNVKQSSNKVESPGISVRQFQLLSWPRNHNLPPSGSHLLDLMELVQSWQQQEGLRPPESHILVHCLNGASRCGIYCALSNALDKMEAEQVLDVFLAVRSVARPRPQVIDNLAQYKFLYEMAVERSTSYNEYANFQP